MIYQYQILEAHILKGSLGLFAYENLRYSNELFLSSDDELDINSAYVEVLIGLFAMKSNILHLAKFSFSDHVIGSTDEYWRRPDAARVIALVE